MTYAVKEIYLTVQGEGANVGRPAVFCRFAGCNLWSGHEKDRASAICRFCDTDFVGTDGPGGGVFRSAQELTAAIETEWAATSRTDRTHAWAVFTGGEPLLQLDASVVEELHRRRFTVAIETNGTRKVPRGIDWICVSPKAGAELLQRSGDELKLVFPQGDIDPHAYEALAFDHFFLQPMDGPERDRNTELAVRYCLDHPRWRLSLQTHKFIGIP
jgi:7-carboxy-7-deazaguanine synthase